MPDRANGKNIAEEGSRILQEQGADAFQTWMRSLSESQRDDVAAHMEVTAEVLTQFMRKWQYTRADVVLYLLTTTVQCPSCQYPNLVDGLYFDHVCHLCGEKFENIVNLGPSQEHTG